MGTISSMPAKAGGDKQNSVISKKSFHRELQPKTIICEAQAKKLNLFPVMEKSKTAVQAKKSVR